MTIITVKPIKLSQAVLDLSAKISKCISVDSDGYGSETSPAYESNLPEDLTMDIVNSVGDYNTTFIAAGSHAFGNAAIEAMSHNNNLKEANMKIAMGGKDSVTYGFDRSKVFHNGLTDSDVEKFGVMNIHTEFVAGKNSGQLKKVRNLLNEVALERLKG
jgi:hypothetical protein